LGKNAVSLLIDSFDVWRLESGAICLGRFALRRRKKWKAEEKLPEREFVHAEDLREC
jgi:hypothetical protein